MKTTSEHFAKFKRACKEWEQSLGLLDWRFHYYHSPVDDALACCNADARGKTVSITLNTEWADHYELNELTLTKTAFHEMCHVLLADLVNAARERVTTDNMLIGIEHSIIRRLERLVLDEQR